MAEVAACVDVGGGTVPWSKENSYGRGKWLENSETRLGKRLAYLLRYGAEQEGLQVHESGFVDFSSLMKIPLMKYYKPDMVLHHIQHSVSSTGRNRFEKKEENGRLHVRAVYGRRMERSGNHEGSEVKRLLECCLDHICGNLECFDLETFPDEFLINSMIHKLRRSRRLNNRSFRSLLSPVIEHLDLGYVYLTENTLKLVANRCPHLKMLSLRECGYITTDHVLANLMKKLPHLETLNLSGCHHLTDLSLRSLARHCPQVRQINLTGMPHLTQDGILYLVTSLEHLQYLNIYDNQNITDKGVDALATYAGQRGIHISLRNSNMDAHLDSSLASLSLASISELW